MKDYIASSTLFVIAFALLLSFPVGRAIAQSSNYDVDKSKDTAHVPYQPPKEPEKKEESETKTILAPTWPVKIPIRVPKETEEKPENPHAGENEGAREGLGGRR